MRGLILVIAISALAWARPETYKETEDFQFSRSSSDEGTKSGYYGAQRGNVGGNYERAHNMDGLAQHQMGSAVRQVQGELGDASKTPTGSVYTAANSRGVYGSGQYDLSNLQGRNFGEGLTVDSSHSSMSSAYNQHSQNSDWRSQSQRAGYGASSQLGQSSLRAGSLHAADGTSGYGTSNLGASHSQGGGYDSASGYQTQSGYNSQNSYDQSQLSESSGSLGAQAGDQSRRYTIITPVRIVGRPGTQVAIPVFGQAYNNQRASSLYDQNFSNRQTYAQQSAASRFDQNAINSEAEVLNNNQQHISSVPVSDGKQYSSSYNYHKAWERRSETTGLPVPVAPTESPLPKQSELYEDAQSDLQQTHSQNSHSGNAYNSANLYNQAQSAHSGSSQSSHQSDYRSQHRSQSEANSNAYTQGTHGSHSGLSSLVDTQPKSYQSSYSYHKSWEKQGDPYVIVPETNGEASQRLTSGNTGASSQRYGSHQHYSKGGGVDCDSLCRYRRATRSARADDYYKQNQEDLGQQAQTGWEENLGQQTQQQYRPAKLEDFGQHAQQFGGNLQDLGQQTQKHWGNMDQQQRPQKLEDLGQQTQQYLENLEEQGQQTQKLWGNMEQQPQPQKLEDLGQQTQQSWDNFEQQGRPQKLEDLGQQTQQSWGNLQQQHRPQKLEDLGQQTQGKWHLDQESESSSEDLGQQTQQSWDKSNIEQQSSSQNLKDLGQQTQGQWETDNQQSQQTFTNLDNLGQQTQSNWDHLESLGQQTQPSWNWVGNIEQQNKPQPTEDLGQQTQNKWDDLDNLGQHVQTQWHNINTINETRHTDTINTEQQTQTHFESIDDIKPNREHAEDNTRYTFNKENSNFNNPVHPTFWDLTDEQKHESNHYYSQHHSNYNHNSYSNSQSHGTSWRQEVNNNNTTTTPNNPLQSLWDKLDNIEEQSEHSSNENQQNTEYENSQHSYGKEITSHHESSWNRRNDSHHQDTYNSGYQPPTVFNLTDKPKNYLHNEAITEKTNDNDLPEEPEPAEIGRGDIGAEVDSATLPKTVPSLETYTTYIKPDKTPEEIEALSLSRGTEEDTSLSVLSISQQKWLEEQRHKTANDLHQISGSRSTTTTSTTTSRNVISGNTTPEPYVPTFNHHENDKRSESGKNVLTQPEEIQQHNNVQQADKIDDYNLQQQNTVHQLEESEKQTHDLNHLPESANSREHSHNLNQGYTGQPLENFGHQSQDSSQQNLQQFTNLGQHQQNTGQQLEDFGQQSQDSSQQNLQQFTNLGQHQQNTGQQLEDFGQQSQDSSQQNLQQFTNLGQHQQNTGQQLEDFGQQSQDSSQQNLQQFTNLGQHQQNTGQQLEDFGQQSQDSSQQNLQQFTNLGQHEQNTGQQLEDFGQQSQDLSQHNLEHYSHLGLHSHNIEQQNTGQQMEDFGQQTQDSSQQNLHAFTNLEQHSQNIDQQNTGQQLEDFGQQSQDLNQQNLQQFTNLGQHSQKFDQENAGQQLEAFGQQSQDLNQQQFTNFGQHSQSYDQENTGQQSEDNGQHNQDLNQQNLQSSWSQNLHQHQAREYVPDSNSQIIKEEKMTPVHVHGSETHPKQEVEVVPPSVTTTEKPGFWKSVGTKLSGAKDSVASWFKKS